MALSLILNSASRVVAGCIFIMALMQPLQCAAEEGPPAPSKDAGLLDFLDKPRSYLSERFVTLSTKVDSFFGDERVFQESRSSFLRLYGDLTYKESQASDFAIKLQAKVILPALQKRLKLVLESDDSTLDSAQVTSVTTQKGIPNLDVPKDFRAALQVLVTDSPHWNINTDGGIRIHGFALDPFVRARARRVQDVQDWQFRFTQTLYWFEQTGAGESSQFDADRKLSEDYLARSRTVATWSDHDKQFYFEQGFYLFQRIDESNALSYQVNAFGVSQANSHVSAYTLSTKWRHRLHREWLFFEVQPLLSWPEEQSFHATSSILFRVEAIFGDVTCGCYGM